MEQKVIKVSQAERLLATAGIKVEQTISGYYRAIDVDGNVIYDDPASEDSEDKESVINIVVGIVFPNANYFVVKI